jgi:hypothetical protein
MRFTRTWKIAVVSGISALALAAAGTTAFAGTTPTPHDTPTVSPNFGYSPPPTPRPVQLRDWQFDLQQSQIDVTQVNDVDGFGAVPFNGWTDVQLSPNVDRFQRGGNSITLWHDSLPFPTVEADTCTINFDQNEGSFRVIAGTGIGAGWRSVNGRFNLRGVISVRDRNGVCPLRFVSLGTILRDVEFNRPLPGQVTFADFAVQGDAKLFRTVQPLPVPHPTRTVKPHETVSPHETVTVAPADG